MRPFSPADQLQYAADAIVSKILLDKTSGSITLFAFDAGQRLSEHTSPFDAVVQLLDGRAIVTIGGEDALVSSGEMVVMPANVPHAVRAVERFKMLLTLIRS